MLDRSLFVPLYCTCEGRKLSAFFFIAKSPLTICESMIAIFCGQSNSYTDLSVFFSSQGEGEQLFESLFHYRKMSDGVRLAEYSRNISSLLRV